MPKLRVIAGAGFYAGVAFLNELKSFLELQKVHGDSDFPELTIDFKNNLNVKLDGLCSPIENLQDNELLLCFSATPDFKSDPRKLSLLNPHWYKSTSNLNNKYILASSHSLESNKFSFLSDVIQPSSEEKLFLAKTIESLVLGPPSNDLVHQFCQFLKIINLKYNCQFVLACTEFLILKKHIALYPFIDPVEAIIKEFYLESLSRNSP